MSLEKGMRVKRGPSWDFGNQGNKTNGTIVATRYEGELCDVLWDNGERYSYDVYDYQYIVPLSKAEIKAEQKEKKKKEEKEGPCKCGGPAKVVEIMNMSIEICSKCKKRKA